jgi:hypothetical protein
MMIMMITYCRLQTVFKKETQLAMTTRLDSMKQCNGLGHYLYISVLCCFFFLSFFLSCCCCYVKRKGISRRGGEYVGLEGMAAAERKKELVHAVAEAIEPKD